MAKFQMLEKIHETFGLSGGPPGWLRHSATTFMVIGIFAAFGLINLRSPQHIAYLEATIILTPTKNGGLLKGEAFTAQLPDGKKLHSGPPCRCLTPSRAT